MNDEPKQADVAKEIVHRAGELVVYVVGTVYAIGRDGGTPGDVDGAVGGLVDELQAIVEGLAGDAAEWQAYQRFMAEIRFEGDEEVT